MLRGCCGAATTHQARSATLKALPCDGHHIGVNSAPIARRGCMDPRWIGVKRSVLAGAEQPPVLGPMDPRFSARRADLKPRQSSHQVRGGVRLMWLVCTCVVRARPRTWTSHVVPLWSIFPKHLLAEFDQGPPK